jgi:uracil-DNA glycosylase
MKRIVFIGQAPARPDSKHGVPGTYVRPWLYKIGISEDTITENFRFYALMSSFPGSDKAGHLRPTAAQILEHRPLLIKNICEFQPDVIVPVGSMAISEILLAASGNLSNIIGNTYMINPFMCLPQPIVAVPLPHPSGRSTWINQHANLLDQGLTLLQTVS